MSAAAQLAHALYVPRRRADITPSTLVDGCLTSGGRSGRNAAASSPLTDLSRDITTQNIQSVFHLIILKIH